MAASPGGAKNGIGWAILAAALAVPGFLFYNWWSHLKAEHDRGVSAKARGRLPEGGVFQTPSPATGRLINPMTSTATAPGSSPAAVAAPPPAARSAAPTAPAVASAPLAAAAPSLPAAPVAAPLPGPSEGAKPVVTPSSATVVLARDPMMSPMDAVRLREEELARVRHEEEMRRALAERNRPRPKPVHHEPPPETRIDLQGIVETPDGAGLAIVNGATVKSGESFVAEGLQGKVKVVRITSSDVTFEYKGKRFKKGVSAE